jgi:DNA-binding GntR family transcriptional regulator
MTLWWGDPGQNGDEGDMVDQHLAIVDAIRKRDADAAAKAAELHSRRETEYLTEQHLRLSMQAEGSA